MTTWWVWLVHDYTGMTFPEIYQLYYLDFLILRRDAFINKYNQTEAGQEYLDKAWVLEQTKPDRAALRKAFGKEADNGG